MQHFIIVIYRYNNNLIMNVSMNDQNGSFFKRNIILSPTYSQIYIFIIN